MESDGQELRWVRTKVAEEPRATHSWKLLDLLAGRCWWCPGATFGRLSFRLC